jgi:hypothetical protein
MAVKVVVKPDRRYLLDKSGAFRPIENLSITASTPVYPAVLHKTRRTMILADDHTHAVVALDKDMLVARNAAERIQLERENTALRQEVAGLIQALDEVQAQQGELMERLRHLSEDGGAEAPGGGLPTALAGASLMELRRRRMREQLAAYVRTGETIRDRLNRERENIEVLFKKGVLSEQAYRRAIMERKTGS